MTATQVFLMFLKKNCTLEEYLFFERIVTRDNGNKYFKKRKLFKPTFVEDYLSRNNRALNNFMIRLFILAPNLVKKREDNPRYGILKCNWNKDHKRNWIPWLSSGAYVKYYRWKWNKFLKECIDESDKKFSSPFKKGETYNFKLKDSGKNSCL